MHFSYNRVASNDRSVHSPDSFRSVYSPSVYSPSVYSPREIKAVAAAIDQSIRPRPFFYQPREYIPRFIESPQKKQQQQQQHHQQIPRALSQKPFLYFDNAASTAVLPDVLTAMIPMLTDQYANPEASHAAGKLARDNMDMCRADVATAFRVIPEEIYFTSGASESINTFIRGVCHSNCSATKRKLVISTIEHKAVSATCADMDKEGYTVVRVPVNSDGIIDLDALADAVDDETLLACIIMANNEIGVLQPIEEISRIVHSAGALLFSDTTQIAGKFPIFPKQLGIDALCISGHKIHGPKGIGALYMSADIECAPIITGGHQERGQRAGTSNTPGINGMVAAIRYNLSPAGQHQHRHVKNQRDWVIAKLKEQTQPGRVIVHCENAPRVNNIISASFLNSRGRPLDKADMMQFLNDRNIIVSTGSACNAGSDRSDVLESIGLDPITAASTLRISLSVLTDRDQCERLAQSLLEMMHTFA